MTQSISTMTTFHFCLTADFSTTYLLQIRPSPMFLLIFWKLCGKSMSSGNTAKVELAEAPLIFEINE